jgi:ABC transport system ATP-binding/permease protein
MNNPYDGTPTPPGTTPDHAGGQAAAPVQRRQISRIPMGGCLYFAVDDERLEVVVSDTELVGQVLIARLSKRGVVELRVVGVGVRPIVDGRPVVHARLRLGEGFTLSDKVFEVTGPSELTRIDTALPMPIHPPPTDQSGGVSPGPPPVYVSTWRADE